MLTEVKEGSERIRALLTHCIGFPTEDKVGRKLEKYFSDRNCHLYRTGDSSGIIGIGENEDGTIEIRHIAVDPEKRKQNMGRRMIDEIIRNHDCSRLFLETDDSAVGFYRRCGFAVERLGEKYPGVVRYRCEKVFSQKKISSLQPSQLYISKEKLAAVSSWLPDNQDCYEPIPVKKLDGRIVITDGHTRLLALSHLGASNARVVWDEDDMDWEAYRVCVKWCLEEGIKSVLDLDGRFLEANDYQLLWIERCRKMRGEQTPWDKRQKKTSL